MINLTFDKVLAFNGEKKEDGFIFIQWQSNLTVFDYVIGYQLISWPLKYNKISILKDLSMTQFTLKM